MRYPPGVDVDEQTSDIRSRLSATVWTAIGVGTYTSSNIYKLISDYAVFDEFHQYAGV